MRAVASAAVLLLAAGIAARAQRPSPAREQQLVSAAWLASHHDDRNLVLLHVGTAEEYQTKHIPGARLVTLDDVSTSDRTGAGLTLEMPAPDDLRQRLQNIGISDDSRIIIYYGTDRIAAATRVFLTLEHAGLGSRASLLDGGMPEWVRAGHPVTDAVPERKTGRLAPLRIEPIVVGAEYVKAHLGRPGVSVVDARLTPFYDGSQRGRGAAGPHRTGHVAGARSIPFSANYDEGNHLRATSELAAIFEKAGVAPADTVIGYCHIGQQATAMLFAARALGHPVLLYDGSFEDWSRRDSVLFRVENPAAARGKP